MGSWNYVLLVNRGWEVIDEEAFRKKVFEVAASCWPVSTGYAPGDCMELTQIDNINGVYLLDGKAVLTSEFPAAWGMQKKEPGKFDVYTCHEGSTGLGWNLAVSTEGSRLSLSSSDCKELMEELDRLWTAVQTGEKLESRPNIVGIYNRLMMHVERKR